MKSFHRLPSWIKVVVPVAFVSLCLGINAIAFTEIWQSISERNLTRSDSSKQTSPEQIFPEQISSEATAQNAASGTAEPTNQLITAPTAQPAQSNDRTTARTATPAATDASGANTSDLEVIGSEASLNGSSTSSNTVENIIPVPSQSKNQPDSSTDSKYGHLPYIEGDPTEMTLVASYAEGNSQRAETLHPEAAKVLLDMIAAARSEGVWLVPASGFRTIAQQRTLFNAQITTQGTPEAAAKISAPPGYSEHHTGYAIDLTDGSLPQTQDISDRFADTEAYTWLLANAATYGFELSFPDGNAQGISFEPWHWRYIGSPQSKAALSLAAPSLDTRNATSNVTE